MSDRPVTAGAAPHAAPPPRRDVPWQAIAGPADRVSFFAAQARYRRQTLRFAIVTLVGIGLMGIPLSIAVAPLIYGLAFIANDVGHWVREVPPWLAAIGNAVEPALDGKFGPIRALPRGSVVSAALLLVLPGFVGMFLLFLVVERVVRRGAVGSVLLKIGAREPRPTDLEEQQLVNVVQEMAIAGGLPPPRVLLFDQPFANAAVVGRGPQDAVVLVSRGMLDSLDRDETQGIVAHLIARIGNGDLRVIHRLLSLSQTMIAGGLWIAAPFGSAARRTLFKLLAGALHPTPKLAEDVGAALLTEKTLDTGDAAIGSRRLPTVLVILLFPVLLLRLTTLAGEMGYNMTRLIFFGIFIKPLLSRIWMTRKLLADATSVELTRNPDGLARAFARMATVGGFTKEVVWAGPLFVLSPASVGEWAPTPGRRPAGAAPPAADEAPPAPGLIAIPGAPRGVSGGDESVFGAIGNADPGIGGRMNRLAYLGAHVALPGQRSSPWGRGCGTVFMVPFSLLALAINVALIGVAMMMYGVGLLPLVALAHVAITYGIPWLRTMLSP